MRRRWGSISRGPGGLQRAAAAAIRQAHCTPLLPPHCPTAPARPADLCGKDGFESWSSICIRFLQQAATPPDQWEWRLVGCAGVTSADTFALDLAARGEQPLLAFTEGTLSSTRSAVLAWQ